MNYNQKNNRDKQMTAEKNSCKYQPHITAVSETVLDELTYNKSA